MERTGHQLVLRHPHGVDTTAAEIRTAHLQHRQTQGLLTDVTRLLEDAGATLQLVVERTHQRVAAVAGHRHTRRMAGVRRCPSLSLDAHFANHSHQRIGLRLAAVLIKDPAHRLLRQSGLAGRTTHRQFQPFISGRTLYIIPSGFSRCRGRAGGRRFGSLLSVIHRGAPGLILVGHWESPRGRLITAHHGMRVLATWYQAHQLRLPVGRQQWFIRSAFAHRVDPCIHREAC